MGLVLLFHKKGGRKDEKSLIHYKREKKEHRDPKKKRETASLTNSFSWGGGKKVFIWQGSECPEVEPFRRKEKTRSLRESKKGKEDSRHPWGKEKNGWRDLAWGGGKVITEGGRGWTWRGAIGLDRGGSRHAGL